MKRAISMLMVVGMVGGFVVFATASGHSSKGHPLHIRTTITHDSTVDLGHGGKVLLSGQVRALRRSCVRSRNVALIAHFTDGRRKVLDADSTSANGAWAVKVSLAGVDRLKAKARREPIRKAHFRGTHLVIRTTAICDSASVAWRVA